VQSTAGTSLSVPITVGGTYFARVKAVNVYGTSVSSPEVSVSVVPPSPKPGAPTGLTASFIGRTIAIAWTAPTTGDPVTNYVLEVGSAPGLANLVVLPVGAGLSFVAPGVPDGTYWLRVRGSNAAGIGVPSQDLGVTMGVAGGCVGLPYAPVLQAPAISGSLLSLAWDAPGGTVAPTSYVLFAGSAPGRADSVAEPRWARTTVGERAARHLLPACGRTVRVWWARRPPMSSVLSGAAVGRGAVPVP
jgi:hypothetical protein